jgi:RimJ/RimL family protein N-acetyltransferase
MPLREAITATNLAVACYLSNIILGSIHHGDQREATIRVVDEVETARLILRPVLRDDLDALARIYARPEVGRYTSRTGCITREQSENIVEHSARLWEQYGYGPWTAIDRATGVIIGRVGLNLLADWPLPDKWEVGWEFDPAFWGRGLATEGGTVGVRLGFEAAGLQRIISATLAQNLASRRVMEKCGLRYEGTLPYHGTELVWYAINRWEWNPRQG